MYIYSDYKAKISQARRNSPSNKKLIYMEAKELKRTVSVEKLNLRKDSPNLQSTSGFLNQKYGVNPTTSNSKTIITNCSDNGKSKKNTPILNFNSYNDNYVNWVNGIKNFSSSKCEKKWQNFQSNIKYLKEGSNYNVESDKIGSLQINKFDPVIDEEESVISRRLDKKRKNNVLKFATKQSDCLDSTDRNSNNNDNKYLTISDKINRKFDLPSEYSLLQKSTQTYNHQFNNNESVCKGKITKTLLKNSNSTTNIPPVHRLQSSSNINNRVSIINNVRIIYSKIRKSGNNQTKSIESNRETNIEERKETNIYNFTENNESVKEFSSNKLKTFKNEKLVESFHKNLIDRKLKAKFDQNKIDSIEKPHLQYIDNTFESIKNKVLLMKGVFDYVYPKIFNKKAEESNEKIKISKEKYNLHKISKNEKSFLIENSAFQIINMSSKKNLASKKEKERCHSLGKMGKIYTKNNSLIKRDSVFSKIRNRKIKQSS